jgi:hypothetical protein
VGRSEGGACGAGEERHGITVAQVSPRITPCEYRAVKRRWGRWKARSGPVGGLGRAMKVGLEA